MLLVLTNTSDVTADYLLSKLQHAQIPYLRFDTDVILDSVALHYEPEKPRIYIDGRWHAPTDISAIWYRRPERLIKASVTDSAEGECVLDEWSEAIEGFFAHLPFSLWMNHPAANALASRKLEQLTTAKLLGLSIPDTLVTQDPQELETFFNRYEEH